MFPYENNEPELVHQYQAECHDSAIGAECRNPDIQAEASDLVRKNCAGFRRINYDANGFPVPNETW